MAQTKWPGLTFVRFWPERPVGVDAPSKSVLIFLDRDLTPKTRIWSQHHCPYDSDELLKLGRGPIVLELWPSESGHLGQNWAILANPRNLGTAWVQPVLPPVHPNHPLWHPNNCSSNLLATRTATSGVESRIQQVLGDKWASEISPVLGIFTQMEARWSNRPARKPYLWLFWGMHWAKQEQK